ncbi:hypothetical protein M4I32_03335 [Microbacterium sp. LRZ72]|uniref:hypothetical protein n=1 Tax=Microbacterium sp. LRZ72 TaxID=2942481 RepID=UPI0029B3E5E6|nr:hypothetical protein [Microbacterium sp. LRZ72]MDX2375829.1 hypothetical protein [Microbacterium sp. LRZ72]
MRTWDDAAQTATVAVAVTDEACPECGSTRVRAAEAGWFVLEFERGDEVRGGDTAGSDAAGPDAAGPDAVEFDCRDCAARWS